MSGFISYKKKIKIGNIKKFLKFWKKLKENWIYCHKVGIFMIQ